MLTTLSSMLFYFGKDRDSFVNVLYILHFFEIVSGLKINLQECFGPYQGKILLGEGQISYKQLE